MRAARRIEAGPDEMTGGDPATGPGIAGGEVEGAGRADPMVGISSPAMREVMEDAMRAAATGIPVLIEGESGVGKEWLARAIHQASPRAEGPMVTLNCGAIPEKLVESILFGHERGAFTGATERHRGKFKEADRGTLFLDEIGELPAEAQVKLLRAVQEGEVEAVGGRSPTKVDVRIVSATNRCLAEEVALGRFREDLYYRLGVFPVQVPPLRERREDIAGLAQGFVERFRRTQGTSARAISPAAIVLLEEREWPGNIRELENAVFRAAVLSDRETLSADDFGAHEPARGAVLRMPSPPLAATAARAPAEPERGASERGARERSAPELSAPERGRSFEAAEASYREAAMLGAFERALAGGPPREEREVDDARLSAARRPAVEALDEDGEMRRLDAIEREMIEIALRHYDGRMSRIARNLGIGRSTLYRKLREYGIGETGREGAA